MVHKQRSRPRGRPRAYDPRTALARATGAFWQQGYAGTSLDRLSEATDMNRPSLYAAFGDKHELYLRTLDRYISDAKTASGKALDYDLPVAQALQRFYEGALSLYIPSGKAARGCYLIATALTEAVADTQVRTKVGAALIELERALQKRLQHARDQGELDPSADTAALATIASALLHTLAVRSRFGESPASLRAKIKKAVRQLCGARGGKAARAPARSSARPASKRRQ